jgi:excinuclease ABC subunit A
LAQRYFDEILKSTSLTAKYLNGDLEISVPKNVENSKISLK